MNKEQKLLWNLNVIDRRLWSFQIISTIFFIMVYLSVLFFFGFDNLYAKYLSIIFFAGFLAGFICFVIEVEKYKRKGRKIHSILKKMEKDNDTTTN